ncbi:hypothetical protein AVEN_174442-1 [Araneus ventricosus]|uniref:Uncharacterized protein n=1 Tax=Araneus ventricosus TaxID=182803 RepID=A0A4Y2RL87_ARAVE|nr:hypothetical protein AVEN_174442-1 [Araneus ventricosus]
MKAGLMRLASFEGREGCVVALGDKHGSGPIILTNHSPFPCALREGYSRGWVGEVNDCLGRLNPIHVVSSPKAPVLKKLEEKSRIGIKELSTRVQTPPRPSSACYAKLLLICLSKCETVLSLFCRYFRMKNALPCSVLIE